MRKSVITLPIALTIALTMLGAPATQAHTPAAEGCGASSTESAHELAVMESAAAAIIAPSSATPPRLDLDRHYAISLLDQGKLKFRLAPARPTRVANARGGVFSFRTLEAGRYRVSLTTRHWVDLVEGEALAGSLRHFGPGCSLVHKIVEFELPGDREITLQLSGRADSIVGLAITAAPAAASPAAHESH
jgi:hypothetical protein